MSIIDKLDNTAEISTRFISDHSKWFYFGGSLVVFGLFVIPETISIGFRFWFIVAMLFASLCIGWVMMLIYLLPFGIIKLICYCFKNPIDASIVFIKIVLSCVAIFLLAMCIHAL